MNQIENIIEILNNIEGSSFSPVKEELISKVENNHPNMPSELKQLYRELGYGCIGESSYMIHVLLEPSEIYDEETANKLSGVLIVGDDFAGNCEAYNTKNNWEFGSIGDNGEFEAYGDETPGLISFLSKWFTSNINA